MAPERLAPRTLWISFIKCEKANKNQEINVGKQAIEKSLLSKQNSNELKNFKAPMYPNP